MAQRWRVFVHYFVLGTIFEGPGEEAQSLLIWQCEIPQVRALSITKKIKEEKEEGKEILKGGYLSYKRGVKVTTFFETCIT